VRSWSRTAGRVGSAASAPPASNFPCPAAWSRTARTHRRRWELLEEVGLDLAALPTPPVLRFVQDQQTQRLGEEAPFRRRHMVSTAHLPDEVRLCRRSRTEQDDLDQAPVVWLPVPDAAGLHLYPAIGPALDQASLTDTTTGGPLLLPAMTGASYQWR
jgi:hypothetical protein